MRKSPFFCFFLILPLLAQQPAAIAKRAPVDTKINIRPSQSSTNLISVTYRIEGNGDVMIRADQQTQPMKMSFQARHRFHERTIARKSVRKSLRDYQEATAQIRLGGGSISNELGPDKRLILTQLESGERIRIAVIENQLTQNELDLLNTPASTLIAADFVAQDGVTIGQSWTPDQQLLCALLNIDEIRESDAQLTLLRHESQIATIQISGSVEGLIDGATTEIVIRGTFQFDLSAGQITTLRMTLNQHREIGVLSPGLDAVFKIETQVRAIPTSPRLSDDALAGLRSAEPNISELLWLPSATGAFSLQHARAWRVISDRSDRAVLRLVRTGEPIAQCDILPLPPIAGEEPQTLEQFKTTILNQLGGKTKIIEAYESVTDSGLEWIRVSASGEHNDISLEWVYYVVNHPDGRRLQLIFTTEPQFVEDFADADLAVLEGLAFAGDGATKNASFSGK